MGPWGRGAIFLILHIMTFRGVRRGLRAFASLTAPRAMPEGPEVSALADGLRRHLLAAPRHLVGARVVSGRYAARREDSAAAAAAAAAAPDGWDALLRRLPLGLRGVRNKGKFIYFELDGGVSLWSTLGMSGGWTLRPHRHTRLQLHLDDSRAAAAAADDDARDDDRRRRTPETLYFYDSRNFGTFKVCFDDAELRARLGRLGPSWPHDEVDLATFRALLGRGGKPQRRRRLAVFLMDQTKTAGVGNYILAEALYAARIHPWARVGDVAQDPGLVETLHTAIREITLGSLASQQASAARRAGLPSPPPTPTASADAFGAGGANGGSGCGGSFALQVYGRRVCGRGFAVVRDQNGPHKRTIHWVPDLQVLGTGSADDEDANV